MLLDNTQVNGRMVALNHYPEHSHDTAASEIDKPLLTFGEEALTSLESSASEVAERRGSEKHLGEVIFAESSRASSETATITQQEKAAEIPHVPQLEAEPDLKRWHSMKRLWEMGQQSADRSKRVSAKYKQSRQELKVVRERLSKELYDYKKKLVGAGREGKWGAFLRFADIPRNTADRYVRSWERHVDPNKFTSGELHPLANNELERLVGKLVPKLSTQLLNRANATAFLDILSHALLAEMTR